MVRANPNPACAAHSVLAASLLWSLVWGFLWWIVTLEESGFSSIVLLGVAVQLDLLCASAEKELT